MSFLSSDCAHSWRTRFYSTYWQFYLIRVRGAGQGHSTARRLGKSVRPTLRFRVFRISDEQFQGVRQEIDYRF